MGLEYIKEPQVFLGGLTALGPGIQNLTENYPLLTTYNYWTSTASAPTCAFPIPDAWSIYNGPNSSGSFIVSVGGVIQPANSYTINSLTRTLMFNSLVSADIEVAATQLATAAPSSQQFSYLKAASADFSYIFATDLSATNVSIISTYLDTTIFSYTAITTATYLTANEAVVVEDLNVKGRILSASSNLFDIFTSNVNFDSFKTSVVDVTGTLLPTTTYQNASGNWQSTYITVSTLSAAWEETADIIPTVTNYLSTNLVEISSLNATQHLLSGNVNLSDIFLTPNNTLTTSVCAMSGDGVTPFVMQFTNGLLTSLTI